MLYARVGFIVKLALMDKGFYAVMKHIPCLEVNTTAVRKHIAEIERELRQNKERMQCTYSDFPF